MRPPSVSLFERLFLFSLLLGLGQAWRGWDELGERAAAAGGGGASMALLLALTFFTQSGLALLVSRGRQASAKWVLVLLCAIGVPLVVGGIEAGTIVGSVPLALLQAALQVGSLALLFTREARDWLGRREA